MSFRSQRTWHCWESKSAQERRWADWFSWTFRLLERNYSTRWRFSWRFRLLNWQSKSGRGGRLRFEGKAFGWSCDWRACCKDPKGARASVLEFDWQWSQRRGFEAIVGSLVSWWEICKTGVHGQGTLCCAIQMGVHCLDIWLRELSARGRTCRLEFFMACQFCKVFWFSAGENRHRRCAATAILKWEQGDNVWMILSSADFVFEQTMLPEYM